MKKNSNLSPVKGSYIFVYGTLKKRFFNPYALALQFAANLHYEAIAQGNLYVFNWYPVAVFNTASPNKILGECFFIPENKLKPLLLKLDRYESIGYIFPEDEYKRMEIDVFIPEKGKHVKAMAYQHIPVRNRRYFRNQGKKIRSF